MVTNIEDLIDKVEGVGELASLFHVDFMLPLPSLNVAFVQIGVKNWRQFLFSINFPTIDQILLAHFTHQEVIHFDFLHSCLGGELTDQRS